MTLAFSRKQQHILILVVLLYGIWFCWFFSCETHKTVETSPLEKPDPPELSVYIDPPIDVNSADAEELELLPGIGPVLSGRIVKYREEHGRITSVESLIEVKRIGPKTVQKLRHYLKIPDTQ